MKKIVDKFSVKLAGHDTAGVREEVRHNTDRVSSKKNPSTLDKEHTRCK